MMTDRTILIVDDHAVLRGVLQTQLLEWFPGVTVVEAGDGETAMDLASKFEPDIAIMDITLPGVNGIATTRWVKERFPHTRVVILSVHELAAYREDAANAGADAYVAKRQMHTELRDTLLRLSVEPSSLSAAAEETA